MLRPNLQRRAGPLVGLALLFWLPAATAAETPGPERFRSLVEGFPDPPADARKAVLLEVRERGGSRTDEIFRWIAPKRRNHGALAAGLETQLGELYDVVDPAVDSFLAPLAERLADFESERALDAQATADLNLSFETSFLFVANVSTPTREECGYGDNHKIELRRLSGSAPGAVRILASTACVQAAGGLDWSWNPRAAGLWGGLVIGLLVVVARGFLGRGSRAPRSQAPRRARATAPPVARAQAPAKPVPVALGGDEELAAQALEDEGEYARAAQLWEQVGDVARAAEAHERAGDLTDALVCYRKLEDLEKVIDLAGQLGRPFEAGKAAFEAGQRDRALQYLQDVGEEHHRYSEGCAMLGAIYFDQGHEAIAYDKLDVVMAKAGPEQIPEQCLEPYAIHLESEERIQDALLVYSTMRERDLNAANVNTRIEMLHGKHRKIASEAVADASGSQTEGIHESAAAPAARAEEPKESRYEIIEELGRGAMGVVYKARDTYLGRTVALKHLVDSLKEHPNAVKFFEREARSAAVLNHPNIVTVYDAGQENGTYFISMEFLEGTPFDAIVRSKGPLDAAIVASLGLQVAAGLHYAHKNKIIHRDIKTANLFLTREKVVKIMDFGLAKMVEEVRRSATIIGGTPYYMPPEQTLGQAVDHRADLYALGVTLFQLLTAAYPFSQGDVAYHHCHTPAPDAREFIATVPPAMSELIQELMAKKAEDRVQSAGEVSTRLQAILDALRNGSSNVS